MNRTPVLTGAMALLVTAAVAMGSDEAPRDRGARPERPNRAQMFERLDRNNDGFLDPSEAPERIRGRLDRMDRDGDGRVSREEFEQATSGRRQRPDGGRPGADERRRPAEPPSDLLFRLLDTNGDGKLSREELENAPRLLERLDRNADGALDADELAAAARSRSGRPGEINTPAARGERLPDRLEVGDPAPDFTLPLVSGEGQVTLSDFRGKRPVVLIFASYT